MLGKGKKVTRTETIGRAIRIRPAIEKVRHFATVLPVYNSPETCIQGPNGRDAGETVAEAALAFGKLSKKLKFFASSATLSPHHADIVKC